MTKKLMTDAEKDLIIRVYRDKLENVTETAKALGIKRTTLYAKLCKLGLKERGKHIDGDERGYPETYIEW